mmetsp:Transcript_16223/g.25102  ORF Transcript_16223/g.25102 Transcript_16223/m.25102 type:complete len:110 (-) Transcript_16223:2612-2941(-)
MRKQQTVSPREKALPKIDIEAFDNISEEDVEDLRQKILKFLVEDYCDEKGRKEEGDAMDLKLDKQLTHVLNHIYSEEVLEHNDPAINYVIQLLKKPPEQRISTDLNDIY